MKLSNLIKRYRELPLQVKASFWFLICGFLTKGVSVITTPIFTRIMTSEEYGAFNVFSSWNGIISVFVSLNLCSGVYSRGLVVYEDRRKEYSSSMQGLCFLLCIIWTIIYLAGRHLWNHIFGLTTFQMLCMLLMIWLNSVFQFWSLNQRVDYNYSKLVMVTLAVTIAQPVLGILLVLKTDNAVNARIFAIILVELFMYTGLFVLDMHRGRKFFVKEFWKQAICFNLPLVPHYLSTTVLNSADRIMIDSMVGSDKAGVYSLAYSVSQIMIIFNTALIQTFEPWLYKKIKAKQIDSISNVAMPSFVLIAVLNILIIFFAPEIIAFFAPPEYYEATVIIPPVAMSVFFMYLYTFFAIFEFYYEKTKYVMIATTSGAVLNILLNYFCINKFGYIAAGYTTLFCYITFAIAHYYFMKKICIRYIKCQVPYKSKYIVMISAALLFCGFIALITYKYIFIRYGILAVFLLVGILKRGLLVKQIRKIISIRRSNDE